MTGDFPPLVANHAGIVYSRSGPSSYRSSPWETPGYMPKPKPNRPGSPSHC
jgi:hypothetical protein